MSPEAFFVVSVAEQLVAVPELSRFCFEREERSVIVTAHTEPTRDRLGHSVGHPVSRLEIEQSVSPVALGKVTADQLIRKLGLKP